MLLSTLDTLPSTLDIVPFTLDPRQLDTLTFALLPQKPFPSEYIGLPKLVY